MRFLVDNAISTQVASGLNQTGEHDARHVREYGLHTADDETILERAAEEDRILVSADTDFGTLLAFRQAAKPSVILFRRSSQRKPEDQLQLLISNLPGLASSLEQGCLAIIEEDRVRVRLLPFGRSASE